MTITTWTPGPRDLSEFFRKANAARNGLPRTTDVWSGNADTDKFWRN